MLKLAMRRINRLVSFIRLVSFNRLYAHQYSWEINASTSQRFNVNEIGLRRFIPLSVSLIGTSIVCCLWTVDCCPFSRKRKHCFARVKTSFLGLRSVVFVIAIADKDTVKRARINIKFTWIFVIKASGSIFVNLSTKIQNFEGKVKCFGNYFSLEVKNY